MRLWAEVNRPPSYQSWEAFSEGRKIAWKTGTSFGYRDAWAVGCTPDYIVGIWVGNADGQGRPGLIGGKVAAPIMLDVFSILDQSDGWFNEPQIGKAWIEVCEKSGYRKSSLCTESKLLSLPKSGQKTDPCQFHKWIHLDKTESWQVSSICENPPEMIRKSYFVLPPVQEAYFKLKNPSYQTVPPWKEDCKHESRSESEEYMQWVYPREETTLGFMVDLDEKPDPFIF